MSETVTVSTKKEFIRWLLSQFQLRKKEATWLFNYLLSDDRLLEKIHFTDDIRNRQKTIVMSTICAQAVPFQFQKLSKIYYDVERAFHDIRLNPDEEVYICVYFKDRMQCPQYLAVLEGSSVDGQRLVQDNFSSLLAEIIMDRAIRKYRIKQLEQEIDLALQVLDKGLFLKLSAEKKELMDLDTGLDEKLTKGS